MDMNEAEKMVKIINKSLKAKRAALDTPSLSHTSQFPAHPPFSSGPELLAFAFKKISVSKIKDYQ
jgi:hypothetical protein